MSLALAIALIAILDVALLALLAYVMTRPRHLTPHAHGRVQLYRLREREAEQQRERDAIAA